MKKTSWQLISETDKVLTYKWKGQTGKGSVFFVFRDEFNIWHEASLEGGEIVKLPEGFLHIEKVAGLLGLSK